MLGVGVKCDMIFDSTRFKSTKKIDYLLRALLLSTEMTRD